MDEVTRGDVEVYEQPTIREYGDLRELTSQFTSAGLTDVPSGFPGKAGDPLFS